MYFKFPLVLHHSQIHVRYRIYNNFEYAVKMSNTKRKLSGAENRRSKLQRQLLSSAQSVAPIKSFFAISSVNETIVPPKSSVSELIPSCPASISSFPASPTILPGTPPIAIDSFSPVSAMSVSSLSVDNVLPMHDYLPSSTSKLTNSISLSMSATISVSSLSSASTIDPGLSTIDSSVPVNTSDVTPPASLSTSSVMQCSTSTAPSAITSSYMPYDIAKVLYPNGTDGLSNADMWNRCEQSLQSLTEHEKYIILTHHFRHFKFPLVQMTNDSRRCCTTMLSNNYVYSQTTNSIFCLPCSLFVPIHFGKKGFKDRHQLSQFVNQGCKDYKRMHEKQHSHNDTEYHKDAIFTSMSIKHRFEQPESSIKAMVDSDLKVRYNTYRHILKRIAQVIHFCGKQGIALRGHNEESEPGNSNPGNFITLLEMFAQEDDTLRDHMRKPLLKNATYIRHRSQNEMIEVIGKHIIQQDIIDEIKAAKFHTLICDEVTSSNDEVLSLCVRFVDSKRQIREEFIEFIDVDRITGEVLFDAIDQFYQKHNLDVMDLRGQCYDGASNMSGTKKGLAGRILEGNPKAVYSHCASHILNLSIVSACKENNIQMVLTQMTSLAIFFNYSPKREKLLECVVDKGTNDHSSSKRKAILGLCKTRWAERDKAYEHFYLSFPFIIKALEIINGTCEDIHQYPDALISGWEPAAKNDTTSHLHALCSFGTIIAIVSIYRLLHPLAMITKCLQGKTVDLIKAFRDIEAIKQDYKVLRAGINDEFQRIYEQAERLCRQVGTEPCMPRTAQKQSYRDNTQADTIQEYNRRTLAIPLLDCITSELDTRFSALCNKASKILFLVPTIVVQDEFNSDVDVNNVISVFMKMISSTSFL